MAPLEKGKLLEIQEAYWKLKNAGLPEWKIAREMQDAGYDVSVNSLRGLIRYRETGHQNGAYKDHLQSVDERYLRQRIASLEELAARFRAELRRREEQEDSCESN